MSPAAAGSHVFRVDTTGLASGAYVYRIQTTPARQGSTGRFTQTLKMLVVNMEGVTVAACASMAEAQE